MQEPTGHFDGRLFQNPVPTEVMRPGSFFKLLKAYLNKPKNQTPSRPPGPFPVNLDLLHQLPSGVVRVTWLGHSTILLDIDGKRFLTDPVWYDRASPFLYLGPKRFFPPPVSLDELPGIDYILLSHDHYDHLDKNAIIFLTSRRIPVITLLGVGRHLLKWGIAKELITETDWWQELTLGDGFSLTTLPARHFSGRWINDRFHTLWGSFAIQGPGHNVYFGADSGFYEGFKTIGERLGPFDLTMLDTGAYHPLWESIHMGPENAVRAHKDLKGKLMMPIHWGTFPLALHPWTEPVERVIQAAGPEGISLFMPAPGQTKIAEEYNSNWWLESVKELK